MQLIAEFFPTALKLYETMSMQNPDHDGLALMVGQLYVTYANAFVQQSASELPAEAFTEQNRQYERAMLFYLRGRSFSLRGLDIRHPGLTAAVFGTNPDAAKKALSKCVKADVAGLYWAASGALGAFSLSPLDSSKMALLPGTLALLERANELDPAYGAGGLQEIRMAFYAGAPDYLGGNRDKALEAYKLALEYSKGQSPSTYIGYAKSFCVPAQDSAGFDEAVAKALAIDPESQPENRLALTLGHRQALWLKEHKGDYFLEF